MKKLLLTFLLTLLCVSASWATEDVYKTLTFSSETNSKGVSAYNATWSATIDNFTWDIANFNNNNNGWKYVKCGGKTAAVATITNASAIDEAITKVVVTIDAITANNVNSIYLYVSTDKTFPTGSTDSYSIAKETGAQTATIKTPKGNAYYKLAFDCKKANSNGLVTVSKVEYYYEVSGKIKTDTHLEWSNAEISCTVGETPVFPTLTCNPASIANSVKYESSDGKIAIVDDSGIVSLQNVVGEATIIATYAGDDDYKASSASYKITVNPAPVDGEFNFSIGNYGSGIEKTTDGNYYETSASTWTSGDVVMKVDGKYRYWNKDSSLRLYKGDDKSANGSLTFTVPAGNAITTITFDASVANMESADGTIDGKVFTATKGTNTVTLTMKSDASSSVNIKTIIVDYAPAAADVTVTIGQYGYTTLYYGEKNLTVPAGVDAYTYRVVGETAVADKTYPAGSVIPAGEAVLLAGAAGEYTFTESATAGEKAAVNCLRGADEDDVIVPAANETLYKLAKGSQGVGFYVAYPDNDPAYLYNAHKAYLAVTTTSAGKAPKYIGLPNNGQSGVVNVIVDGDDDVNAPAYNVMGQKVTNDYKGFVIKNGKKMYNK